MPGEIRDYLVSGDHGWHSVDRMTGAVLVSGDDIHGELEPGRYEDFIITRFDVRGLERHHRRAGGEPPGNVDILDIGYWYRLPDGSDGYEEAVRW
jgi:hypothetical protein